MIHLQEFDRIFAIEVSIAAFVFVVVLALLAFAVIRRRSGAVTAPSSRSSLRPVEVSYVLGLAVLGVFLVVITARSNDRVAQAQEAPAATVVDVTAFQWCWQFSHAGTPVSATGSCSSPSDRPTLVVPTGRPVQLRLHSRDVIHAFWVPGLAVKMDVFPNHTNTLTLVLDRNGRWLGRCSEFCGQYHAMMEFYVQAVPPQQYQAYLASGGAAVGTGA